MLAKHGMGRLVAANLTRRLCHTEGLSSRCGALAADSRSATVGKGRQRGQANGERAANPDHAQIPASLSGAGQRLPLQR